MVGGVSWVIFEVRLDFTRFACSFGAVGKANVQTQAFVVNFFWGGNLTACEEKMPSENEGQTAFCIINLAGLA